MSIRNLQLTSQQYTNLKNNDSFISEWEGLGLTFGLPNFDSNDVNSFNNFVNSQDNSTYNIKIMKYFNKDFYKEFII